MVINIYKLVMAMKEAAHRNIINTISFYLPHVSLDQLVLICLYARGILLVIYSRRESSLVVALVAEVDIVSLTLP